ncbi:SDR family oxidoreductase [Thermoactinomyces sp. CICC 23799]|jgi:uncharacterized protein YbjT (DUF2867 family)|uniref:SDR family oxidoreductase n=1 Tax=Thermoactinomyces sp. CICC 23799 TaxID=2767429 RepID=UPI0018DBF2AB|nr:SDR family oxidoreductase [Thermoactinomyces sp. CICC 23799]MBH8600735.1 SDR family oxidoreductase [Thermoactinomyces sp. CICC 23799]
MNILLLGANGKIGRKLVSLLKETPHHLRAMVRKEEQVPVIQRLGADEVVIGDLEKDFSHWAEGMDAIIFSAGSGGHTGPDKTILVDLDGAFKAIEAAEQHQVGRFVMISSIGADQPEKGPDSIRHYLVAKKRADERLRNSSLNYTIIRPGALTNDPAKGTVLLREHIDQPASIPRADVARVVGEALEHENTYRRSFDLVTGDQPIQEALNNL